MGLCRILKCAIYGKSVVYVEFAFVDFCYSIVPGTSLIRRPTVAEVPPATTHCATHYAPADYVCSIQFRSDCFTLFSSVSTGSPLVSKLK